MTKAVDKVQSSFKCCGARGKSDWNGTDWGKAHPDKVITTFLAFYMNRACFVFTPSAHFPTLWI